MDLGLKRDLATVTDLRHRVRRLGWFRDSFRRAAGLVGAHHGVAYAIDDRALAAAFFGWLDAFTAHRAGAGDRRDFSVFSAGLMLAELVRAQPARVDLPAAGASAKTDPAAYWPEGFLYVQYCVAGLAAVVEQDFREDLALTAAADDIRTWWSFRENVLERPELAIAFLDHFVGLTPNWQAPQDGATRRAAAAQAQHATTTPAQHATAASLVH